MTRHISVLFVLLLTLTSCPKDDDGDVLNGNTLIGTWKPIKDVDVCSENDMDVFNFSPCMQEGRFIFQEDGSFSSTEYEEVFDCQIVNTTSGTWELNSDSLTLITEEETLTLTFFELLNNTLRLGVYETDPNSPCNEDGYYYLEYVRVN